MMLLELLLIPSFLIQMYGDGMQRGVAYIITTTAIRLQLMRVNIVMRVHLASFFIHAMVQLPFLPSACSK